jgi:hypothetical protein
MVLYNHTPSNSRVIKLTFYYFNWSASYENHLMSDPNAPPEKMTNFEVLTSKDNNSYLLVYSAKREGNNNNSPFNQFFPIA